MKLSTRGRYGLRMLVDLCLQDGKLVTLASIAQRQEVSPNYLELVAKDIKRAGYVRSVKGINGGYALAQNPNDIIIGDVLSLLEGDVRFTDDVLGSESILQQCIRENIYDPLNESMSKLFYSVSLLDLIDKNQYTI